MLLTQVLLDILKIALRVFDLNDRLRINSNVRSPAKLSLTTY